MGQIRISELVETRIGVSAQFRLNTIPESLTGTGLCSDEITFKHITMHECEARRVIAVRNSEIETNSRNRAEFRELMQS